MDHKMETAIENCRMEPISFVATRTLAIDEIMRLQATDNLPQIDILSFNTNQHFFISTIPFHNPLERWAVVRKEFEFLIKV